MCLAPFLLVQLCAKEWRVRVSLSDCGASKPIGFGLQVVFLLWPSLSTQLLSIVYAFGAA